MEYFAGLDVSMDETHMCVVDRNGGISSGDKTEQLARGNRGGADESTEMAREAGQCS